MHQIPLDPTSPYSTELGVAIAAAQAASNVILDFYDARTAGVHTKGDGSPVTDADIAADAAIRELVLGSFPDDALITEEGMDDTDRLDNRRVWIVDPIDGTAQFVARTGRFDVLIALAIDGVPAVAVTIQPTTKLMHAAIAGQGAWRNAGDGWEPFRISDPAEPPRITGSKYYLDEMMDQTLEAVVKDMNAEPSSIMDVGFQPRAFDDSERWYDVFLGFPQDPAVFAAQEWDIAASDLIVHEAGGRLTDVWGRRHGYNKRSTSIRGGVLACATPELHGKLVATLGAYLAEHPQAPGKEDTEHT